MSDRAPTPTDEHSIHSVPDGSSAESQPNSETPRSNEPSHPRPGQAHEADSSNKANTISPAADLQQAAEAFRQWRQARKGRGRIPKHLWELACQVAQVHGVSQTSHALRVNYTRLKQRLANSHRSTSRSRGSSRRRPSADQSPPTFVPLPPLALAGTTECDLQLERKDGVRITLRWKGCSPPDFDQLGRLLP